MVESGVNACASDTRASGGDCVGRFGLTENDGPSKLQGMKLQDMKMQDMEIQDMKMQDFSNEDTYILTVYVFSILNDKQ